MTETIKTYRNQFIDEDSVSNYDTNEYADYSYGSLLWHIEKEQLSHFLRGYENTKLLDYLDFACGTGRVISQLETHFGSASGIEISSSMIERAKRRTSISNFFCIDISCIDDDFPPHKEAYDLISAFRFFLNAEPDLRLSILERLKSFLKKDDSVLIFNNHGNLFSHKLLLWPYHAIKNYGKGYRTSGNYMTHGEVLQLLDAVGLEVIKKRGCGILSPRILTLLPFDSALKLERFLANTFLNRIAVNQMYFVKKKY